MIHQSTYLTKMEKKTPDNNNNNSEEKIHKIFRYFSIHDESKAYHEMNESTGGECPNVTPFRQW
jgi:hypothetical protein